MSVTVRPLRTDETELVQPLAARAFDQLHGREGRPPRTQSGVETAAYRAMHAHLQASDPAGCLLALAGDEPVGAALSYVRGPLWVLALLVVEPGRQSAGTGSALLHAALRDAPPLRVLHASSDARAMRAYTAAGFRLLPAMLAEGVPSVDDAPPLVDAPLDGPLAPDLAQVRMTGGAVRCLASDPSGQRGRVALVGPPERTSVSVLDPVDEGSGAELLRGGLAGLDRAVQVGPLAPQEHWAVEVALRAGLQVRGCGPVMLAGLPDPLGGVAAPAAVYL